MYKRQDYNTWQTEDKKSVKEKASEKVAERLAAYQEPEKTTEQMKVIEKYLIK